ncbi:MAG TPA: helix-turn-helix domain-containing protein [Ornithinibacter sp.]|nr:helix-turn-helix domain-containing protein [Ornithinibacter sp.]
MTAAAPHDAAALLASPVRRQLVDALAHVDAGGRSPGLTAAQLAGDVGLHVTTVRFHLDQLVAAGLVEAEVRREGGAGRPRKFYTLAQGSLEDVDPRSELEPLRLLSGLLAQALTVGVSGHSMTPAEAGRSWAVEHVQSRPGARPADTPGRWLGKLAQMIDVLQEWGYTPELRTSEGGRTALVTLAHCPFLELARANPAVVCGIHRGLIAGSLEQLGETATRVSLEPFVDATTCLAHVTTTTPFRTISSKEPA